MLKCFVFMYILFTDMIDETKLPSEWSHLSYSWALLRVATLSMIRHNINWGLQTSIFILPSIKSTFDLPPIWFSQPDVTNLISFDVDWTVWVIILNQTRPSVPIITATPNKPWQVTPCRPHYNKVQTAGCARRRVVVLFSWSPVVVPRQ